MSQYRYLISFFITSIASIALVYLGLFLAKNHKSLTATPPKVIKVALLTPVVPVKKVTPVATPITPPKRVVSPPLPKVQEPKKPKKKPIVHKNRPKPKSKPKPKPKKRPKVVTKKKPKPKHKPKPKPKPKKVAKKSTPKKTTKKHTPSKKSVVKKVVQDTPPVAYQPTYRPIKEHQPHTTTQHSSNQNAKAKKEFLRKVRAKIIANKKYPRLALRRHIEGSVKVKFDITKQGDVNNIRFINGKHIFYKSIKKTLQKSFPVAVPSRVASMLPIQDISVVLHFNIK